MLTIYRSEASASLRRIPMWLVGSDGTTPASAGGGQPQINWLARGTATVNTAATLSLVSANAGEHYVELSASEVSAVGIAAIHYRAAAVLPNSTYFQIAAYDSNDSVRLGLFALPNAAAAASGGLPTFGTGTGQLNLSSGSVGLIATTHSGATVAGLSSGVTLFANTHSGATIQGLTLLNSGVTINNATYSAVTVRVDPQNYSGLTVGVGNLAPGSYSGVSVEVTNILQSVRSQIADDFLRRDIAAGAFGGRSVQDALRPLRNRVLIEGSTMTVYTEDDATSAWTASVSTIADVVVTGINPAGP
jgi:hypothetical protein